MDWPCAPVLYYLSLRLLHLSKRCEGQHRKGLTAGDVSNAQHSSCPFGDWQHYRRLASSRDTERLGTVKQNIIGFWESRGKTLQGRYRPAFVYMSLKQSFDLKFLTILRNFACPSNIRVSLSTPPCNFQSQSCVTASKPRLVFQNVTRITCSTLVLCGRIPFTGPIGQVPHSRSTLLRVSKLGHSSSSSSSRRIQTYSTLTCAHCQMSFCYLPTATEF